MTSYVVKKRDAYWPSKAMKDIAWVNDEKIYRHAEENPVKFWSKLARGGITWEKIWDEKNTYTQKLPYFWWFKGAKLNFCFNALDRHYDNPDKIDKTALIWVPEPIKEKTVKLTYRQLYEKVNKFANVLKKQGVKKGDRVAIYLPLIPEALISMLACTRIGAIHSVVFSAFSADALNARILDGNAKILISCDGYYRRGEKEDMKNKVDEAIKGTKLRKIIIVNRLNKNKKYRGKFLSFEKEMKKAQDYCKPETMNSEDPLFILYTSGCCHGNSLIQLKNGEVTKIKDIVDNNLKSKIINIDKDSINPLDDTITDLHKYPNNSTLYKIRTPSFEATFTSNHRLFSLDEYGNIIEKEAHNLVKGDKVFAISKINISGVRQIMPLLEAKREYRNITTYKPENIPRIPQFLTPGFAQIIGYLIGDGHLDSRSVIFTDKDKKNLEFYKKLIKDELNLESNIREKSERQRLLVNSSLFKRYIKEFLPELVCTSKDRNVPKIIQKSENKCIAGFLRGLFDAEGTIGYCFIKLTSTSKDIIRISQFLLRRFGIIGKVYPGMNKERKIKNRVIKQSSYLDLIISDRESLDFFYKDINFSDELKKTKLERMIKNISNKRIFSKSGFPIFSLLKELTKTIKVDWKGDFNKITKFVHNNNTDKKGLNIIKDFLDNKIEIEKGEEKLEKLKEIRNKIKKLLKFEGVILEKILDIRNVDNDYDFVYDLTAQKNHNYIVNGFVTHNTTGKPKGIVHDTGGYAVQAYWTSKWNFNLHETDVMWCTADIGWITGHTYAVYGPLLTGNTTLIYEGAPDFPDPSRWWKIINEHKVTVFYTAPTVIRMYMKYPEKYLKKYKLDSLRILGTVGEPIDEEAWEWYFKNIGKSRCPILDTWWQTETGGTLINTLPGVGPFVPTLAGKSFPGTKHIIVNNRGKEIHKDKTTGFLVQLSPFAPGMLHGIWNNHEKYVETYWKKFKNKYDTSDGAYVTNKLIRITGRTDDVMKVAGHRLATAELENAINEDEYINESAVISIPDKIKGEVPVAFVVLEKKISLNKLKEPLENRVKKQVDKKIGPIARPSKIYVVDELPKTRSGKIMRRILKNILNNEEPKGVSTLVNPDCVERIKEIISEIKPLR